MSIPLPREEFIGLEKRGATFRPHKQKFSKHRCQHHHERSPSQRVRLITITPPIHIPHPNLLSSQAYKIYEETEQAVVDSDSPSHVQGPDCKNCLDNDERVCSGKIPCSEGIFRCEESCNEYVLRPRAPPAAAPLPPQECSQKTGTLNIVPCVTPSDPEECYPIKWNN